MAVRNKKLPDEASLRSAERTLITQAREWGIGIGATGNADDMYVLALMQHHGLPTRLLDVTANPITALWFACQQERDPAGDPIPDHDGVLIAFNVTDLPKYDTAGVQTQTWAHVSKPTSASWERALERSSDEGKWFLLRPTVPDIRMTVQEGLFLTSAVPNPTSGSQTPLDCIFEPGTNVIGKLASLIANAHGGQVVGEKLPGPAVVSFTVPAALKHLMRAALAGTFNRSERSMYPDLMGFRDALGGTAIQLPDAPLPSATAPSRSATTP